MHTADVAALLRRHLRPEDEDDGDSVALLAEKAETSTRTVYRVIAGSSDTLSLDLADRLLTAVFESINDCRLVDN